MLAFRNRALTTQKYANLQSFLALSFDFLELLDHQGLSILISYSGPYFPDLVLTFYCNLSISIGCIVKSCVKVINIVLSMKDFGKCLNVPYEGEMISQVSLVIGMIMRIIYTITTLVD